MDNAFKDLGKLSYADFSFKKDLEYIRPVLLISMLLYASFALMDFLIYPQYIGLFLTIRFLFVLPVFFIGYLCSFYKSFRHTYQYVLMSMLIVGGIGIIAMIFAIQEANYYYSGLYLVFSIAFFLLRLKTVFASIGSATLIMLFVIIGLTSSDTLPIELIAHSVFYSGFAFIGIIGARYHEAYRYNQYYQDTIILGENIVLEKEIFKQFEDIKNYHSATIFAIAKLAESRDQFTGEHITRVGILAKMLSEKIPTSIYYKNDTDKEDFVASIELASILHDIGKISISDVILNKPGKLTVDEFEIVKTHTTVGYKTLKLIEQDYDANIFISLGIEISKSHHERWDGTGYPEGLSTTEIPLSARIVSLIDVFDALISRRSYKLPFSKTKSLNLTKEGVGTQFDPELALIFIQIIEESENKLLFGK